MWNTSCSNRICFTQDKTTEQNLHLQRLFCVRPEINVKEPYIPKFLRIRGPQKEKRRQTQDKIDKDNFILEKKIIEIYIKNGKYSKYEVEPKQIYPAFRRYSRLKLSDIIKLINIHFDNKRLENKIINLKSTYDNREMRKEAEKQEKYLQNILNRPKSIPFAPALKFYSLEQLHNRFKKQLIRQQRYFSEKQNNNGNVRHSTNYLRTNTNNNSRINKSNGQTNKNENMTNRSQRSQSSKNRKSLKLNSDINIENNNGGNNKKIKNEIGTTKDNTNTIKK